MNAETFASEAEKKSKSGFRLEIFNFIIIVFTVVITLLLSVVIYKAHSTYNAFYDATEEYIACRSAAEEVHEASEYLTNEVRAYVFTGHLNHLDDYFSEVNVVKRRERALNTIKAYVKSDGKEECLNKAVSYSRELMNIEYYAMRLRLEADKVDKSAYPQAVKSVTLKPEDAALKAESKRDLAKELVLNEAYGDYKDRIYKNVSDYTNDLLNSTRRRERDNSVLFSNYQQLQMILIVVLICILMLTVAFTTIFLIRPLRKSSKLIVDQDEIPVKGTQEMRTFAVLYNKALNETKTRHKKLSYEASHDSLTGIRNRSAFDDMYNTVANTSDITLLLVDIDAFKEINDTHGHEIGDRVLKKVADLMRVSFRTGDLICRIGGDEFTVVLNGVSENYREQLEFKITSMMKKLDAQKDDLPKTNISVGIAFGNAECTFKDLYKHADEALYAVKSTTKNGYNFYEG